MRKPINSQVIDKTDYEVQCTGNLLICTVGLPRSGKSTWARQTGNPVVNPEGIRLALTGRRWYGPIEHEVWATARTMVRALFLGGHKIVVLDSTNLHRHARDTFVPSPDCVWKREYILFDTPAHVCERRAEQSYPVLHDVILYMDETREPIDEAEEGKIVERIVYDGGIIYGSGK
jgi:predicted kinase